MTTTVERVSAEGTALEGEEKGLWPGSQCTSSLPRNEATFLVLLGCCCSLYSLPCHCALYGGFMASGAFLPRSHADRQSGPLTAFRHALQKAIPSSLTQVPRRVRSLSATLSRSLIRMFAVHDGSFQPARTRPKSNLAACVASLSSPPPSACMAFSAPSHQARLPSPSLGGPSGRLAAWW